MTFKAETMANIGLVLSITTLSAALYEVWTGNKELEVMFLIATIIWAVGGLIWNEVAKKEFAQNVNK
jgi:hypothetical protein